MKRVLCLLSCMNAGGAETFLMKLYRAIDRSQYQMDFCVTLDEECFYDKEICSLGGRIFTIPPKSQDLRGYREGLMRVVRENEYRYVLRITSHAVGFLDIKLAKAAGATRCAVRSSNASDGAGLLNRLLHRVCRALWGRCVDVKIAPSDLAGRYTFGKRAVKNGEVHWLRNALDLDCYRFDGDGRVAVRREFGIEDRFVVGHVGRFDAQKNHRFLIELFDKIRKQRDDAVLMLVGDGPLETEIRADIARRGLEDCVVFTGVRADMPRLFSAMDCFVFPSLYEGMPNAVIEAQATGLPCVIADTITKEAAVTALVTYLPLRDSAVWAQHATAHAHTAVRQDTKEALIKNGYDIRATANEFIKQIFGE